MCPDQLKSNSPRLMDEAVLALRNLSRQCSDSSATEALTKHLFAILGGELGGGHSRWPRLELRQGANLILGLLREKLWKGHISACVSKSTHASMEGDISIFKNLCVVLMVEKKKGVKMVIMPLSRGSTGDVSDFL